MNVAGPLGHVVVVGASLAGLRAAETLRNEEYGGPVTVIGAETARPYDRPPLSKRLLSGEWEPDRIELRRADTFDELDVEWRLGTAVVGLDERARTIELAGGETVAFDGAIIATGAHCRRLPDQDRFDHVHELRTLDDSLRLRDRLTPGGQRVVVVGAGFIGLEVAATARTLGNEVTVLEGASAPLTRALGAEVGLAIGRLHEAEGVVVRCDVAVERFDEHGVLLVGGELVEADVVVVGIGVAPADEWLASSTIERRDGIRCTSALAVRLGDGTASERIFAAGDVARWYNPLYDEEMRVEHWTNAAEQGAQAARNLLASVTGAAAEPYSPVPFFWSDQFDHRIQFLGRAGPDDDVDVVVDGSDDGKMLVLFGRAGRLRAVLGVNAPRWVMPMRQPLLDAVSWDDGRAIAAERVG